MFETIADELRTGAPIGSWRRTYRTTESRIVAVLEETVDAVIRAVLVGSYPSFAERRPRSRSCSSRPTPVRSPRRSRGSSRRWTAPV